MHSTANLRWQLGTEPPRSLVSALQRCMLMEIDSKTLASVLGGTQAVWSPQLKIGGTGNTLEDARQDFLRRCAAAGQNGMVCQTATLDSRGATHYNPELDRYKPHTPFRKPAPGYGAD